MSESLNGKVALITGAAKRIGAEIARTLHGCGANVVIHYRGSASDALALCDQLNDARSDSAALVQADLLDVTTYSTLLAKTNAAFGNLDILINNASAFYPTPIGTITEDDWRTLTGSNLKAPLFLSQAFAAQLTKNRGCIVNLVDIHAKRPLRDHAVYGPAKAGLAMLTRSLAKDLAPDVRVNGVAPGAILWPEDGMDKATQQAILDQVPLGRTGTPQDIASCVLFLVCDAHYITGQVVAVDGGRSTGW
ncbi:MAG: pteridine reductase [Pseudomonadota bacterium]